MRSATHREDLYDLTYSSLVSIQKKFCSVFTPKMALAIEILVLQFSSIILSIGPHGLGLVTGFCAKNLHLLFYISFSSGYVVS
jgi:hypothetical protein